MSQPQPTLSQPQPERLPIVTGEWPPYSGADLPGQGCSVALTTAIVRNMGMEPDYLFAPWKRAEQLLVQGRAFGAVPYKITEARRTRYDFSEAYLTTRSVFIYHKPRLPLAPAWSQLADLRPYRISALLGSYNIDEFAAAGLDYELVVNPAQSVRMLYSGRVDLVVGDEAALWWQIRDLYPDQLDQFGTLPGPVPESENVGLMISRRFAGTEALRRRFDASLAELRRRPDYPALGRDCDLQHLQRTLVPEAEREGLK